MNSPILKPRVRKDISVRVDKVLRELDYPEPPLRLEEVRTLLELDLGYFSAESDGLMKRMVSRLRRGGKQILARPHLLLDAILKFDLRAVYLPDEKRVLIDEKVPQLKQRWLEAHEIGHRLLDWHHDMMLGDDETTVALSAHSKMEAEANYAAGSLIFLGNRFEEECRSSHPSLSLAKNLAKKYGNSITSTLWRIVEHSKADLPIIAIIGAHPKQTTCILKHIVLSTCFDHQFETPSPEFLVRSIRSYYNWKAKGPLGIGEVIILDKHSVPHCFEFESFCNGYDTLTIGVWKTKKSTTSLIF